MVGENRIARFGLFELDVNAATLRKNGVRIKLQDQPLQILSVLLDRPGEIVTREELCRRLWPDGTFVDFDHSLNASVNKLRDALGDTASNPRFIETVPRRGYRFIAPVERPEPPSLVPAAPLPPDRRSRTKTIIAAAATLVVISGAFEAWRRQSATRRDEPLKVVPLTSTPGHELQPSFSPDGNYVAYSGGPGKARDIYVKQIGSETVRRLTSDAALDVSPRWSPDGRHIAFVRVLGDGEPAEFAALIIPASGGAESKVGTGWLQLRTTINNRLLDWFPDSENIAVADAGAKGETTALFGLNVRTGERWRLTNAMPVGKGDFEPALSPEGRRLAFTRYVGNNTDVYLSDLDDRRNPIGEPRALISGSGARAPVWTPDGRDILFSSGAHHRPHLARLRVAARSVPERAPFAAEGNWGLAAAISTRWQVAYAVTVAQIDVYRTELEARTGRGVPFLKSTFVEHLPEYSPDGKRIAFVSNRSGSQQIWVCDAEAGNWHRLTSLADNAEATWPRWSPDGRRLVFTVGRSVYVVPSEGGPAVLRFKDVASRNAIADWSPDGKWLYVISNRSGRDEVWRAVADTDADGDRTTRVTHEGADSFRVSPDGEFIYFAKGAGPSEIWRVGVNGKYPVRLIEKVSTSANFAVTREGVYFIPVAEEIGGAKLMFLNPSTRSRRVFASLEGQPLWGLTISPDRRYALHTGVSEAEGDLMLVENFR